MAGVERSKLEEWIKQLYRDTERFIADHPFSGSSDGRSNLDNQGDQEAS
jgi:hypothetical protein